MNLQDYVAKLKEFDIYFIESVLLSNYCTYGTGGIGRLMVFPKDHEELIICSNTPCEKVAIGYGSNILFSDYGYNGVIINTSKMDGIKANGSLVVAQSGAKLSKVREYAELNCLSGLEFTEGIPATIGGAICMNAGCFSKNSLVMP